MGKMVLLIDLDNCVGCHACEIACWQEHGIDSNWISLWCKVKTIEPRWMRGNLHMDFVPAMCFHCDEPFCAVVCPTGAITKMYDSRVIVREDSCSGCRLCVNACPYGLMSYQARLKKAAKCDLCLDRTQQGLQPSCVQHCIGGALQYIAIDEIGEVASDAHLWGKGLVFYGSSKWRLGLP